ncbi:MAG: DUF3365 domain-containing protein [Planctomycetota bacterium]
MGTKDTHPDGQTTDVPPPRPDLKGQNADDLINQQVGSYKVLQLIGEGGFGCVYMAQQVQPVKRRVALKVLKPGMDSKQVIGRFESERQALAMMDHPNIARIFDAGTTPQGRLYFAMELVRGEPITAYCDGANLSTRERLDLFVSVCQALQHAHTKGIIHRDVKPSNVLVTLHDEKPVVKVIDFGIAKAVNQDLTDRTVFTEFRQFMGTPEYMSPEQASMSGLDADTRTDIYSLGVVLYELMAGSTPFEKDKLKNADLDEVRRIIREEDPPAPSARIARPTTDAGRAITSSAKTVLHNATNSTTVAKHRRTDPRTLRHQLRGELDWIVMRCLEKDRTRRYETASALADDILRHIRNEPVLARPATTAYRVRKFARRNRLALGIGVGTVSLLLLTLVALAYGLLDARHERDMTAQRETVTRAQMLLSSMNSVRAYTIKNVRPALLGADKDYTQFSPEMVPGFAARKVFEEFRSRPEYAGFTYKEASPNPTNPTNKADSFEAGLITTFHADREHKEDQGIRIMDGVQTFYIARPMIIADAKCLDCHTTPETAPKKQVELYGKEGGYGWKLGDTIATQIVYVPVSQAFASGPGQGRVILITLASLLVLGGGAAVWLLRRA